MLEQYLATAPRYEPTSIWYVSNHQKVVFDLLLTKTDDKYLLPQSKTYTKSQLELEIIRTFQEFEFWSIDAIWDRLGRPTNEVHEILFRIGKPTTKHSEATCAGIWTVKPEFKELIYSENNPFKPPQGARELTREERQALEAKICDLFLEADVWLFSALVARLKEPEHVMRRMLNGMAFMVKWTPADTEWKLDINMAKLGARFRKIDGLTKKRAIIPPKALKLFRRCTV
jgi:hypothetical protein